MSTALMSKSESAKQPAILKLTTGNPFFQHMNEVYDRLAHRAYELFDGRGRQDGHDQEDWFRAESELLSPVLIEIEENEKEMIVRADVPGFRDKDLEVAVEPHRLIISGKREEIRDQTKRKAVYTERRSDEVLRTIDFSEEIDPENASATLHDGTLEISVARAHPANKSSSGATAA
jgi:HSP20 family protein